jgi:glycolate oxidase FAD binding subunit
MLRLSGSEAGVRLTKQKMGGEEIQNAGEYWQSLREQTHHFFAPDDQLGLWRLSLPSTAPALKIRAKSLIEWGGAQRWLWTHESAQSLHAIATQAGGYATLFRHGEERALAQMPLAKPLLQIHRQLKAAFDPHDIFNRGRLFDTCPRS